MNQTEDVLEARRLLGTVQSDPEMALERAQTHAILALVETLTPVAKLCEMFAYPETALTTGGVVNNGPIERVVAGVNRIVAAVEHGVSLLDDMTATATKSAKSVLTIEKRSTAK